MAPMPAEGLANRADNLTSVNGPISNSPGLSTPPPRLNDKELHIAPMLDVSTYEFRHFMRVLTHRSILWTEMVVGETLFRCDPADHGVHLAMDEMQRPVVCQIGGNVPSEAVFATRLAHQHGFDRVDLNAGCPSDRVAGRREFGAALMKDQCVAVDMVRAMVAEAKALSLPFSVKTRIGVDDEDSWEFLLDYVGKLVDAGCRRFVIHARKVLTQGLSPAQNRSIPPLNYQRVYALCEAFPHCDFWLNGGLRTLKDARRVAYGDGVEFSVGGKTGNVISPPLNSCESHHSVPCAVCCQPHGSCVAPPSLLSPSNLRGVMLGRLAMDNPSAFAKADSFFFGESRDPSKNRREVLESYATWLEQIYPRRCCDDDARITKGMHLDGQCIARVRNCCHVCKDIYGGDNGNDITDTEEAIMKRMTLEDNLPEENSKCKRHNRKCPGAKILSRSIDRCLKPTFGILYGMRGNNNFRRELHRLSRDMQVRNCGPGFILRKAMESVKSEVWDMDFFENLP